MYVYVYILNMYIYIYIHLLYKGKCFFRFEEVSFSPESTAVIDYIFN